MSNTTADREIKSTHEHTSFAQVLRSQPLVHRQKIMSKSKYGFFEEAWVRATISEDMNNQNFLEYLKKIPNLILTFFRSLILKKDISISKVQQTT